MSLINEALKKAQSQRANPPTTPPPGAPPATANSSAPQPSPFSKVGVLIAVCAVIVSLSVLGTVFLLRSPSNASSTNAQTPRIASSDTAAPHPLLVVVPLRNVSAPPSTTSPAAVSSAPAASVAATEPAAAPANIAPAAVVAVATPIPTPEPTPVKVTVRIQSLVDKFRISGIRLSENDSKVILNDHLFHVDDPIESSLGLRLTKIEEHRLTFVDADGNTYVKRF